MLGRKLTSNRCLESTNEGLEVWLSEYLSRISSQEGSGNI